MDIVQRLLEVDNLKLIIELVFAYMYISGRITKGQFIAEQMKVKGMISPDEAKSTAVESATKPVTVVFDLLNMVPILNIKLPILGLSLPDIGKGLVQAPIGVLSDILHNIPLIGTNIKGEK